MSSAVIAPVDFQKADVCPVCLELVLIDKLVQGNSYWRVVRFSNHFLFFTKYLQNLGSVVYDIARGRFIVPQSLPEKPIRVSEGCSFYRDNADQPAVSVIYKDGILQVHGAEDYDRLVGLFGPKENGVRLSKVVNAIGLQGIQLPADIVVSTIVLAPLESAEDSEDGLPA